MMHARLIEEKVTFQTTARVVELKMVFETIMYDAEPAFGAEAKANATIRMVYFDGHVVKMKGRVLFQVDLAVMARPFRFEVEGFQVPDFPGPNDPELDTEADPVTVVIPLPSLGQTTITARKFQSTNGKARAFLIEIPAGASIIRSIQITTQSQ